MRSSCRSVIGRARRRSMWAVPTGARCMWRAVGGGCLTGPLAGCSTAPSQNIFGSFFPSWLLCGVLGITAAVIMRQVLRLVGLGDDLWLPFLSYPAMALAVTFGIWLIWFGN